MIVEYIIEYLVCLLTGKLLDARSVPEFLEGKLEEECKRLGIDPNVVEKICLYRKCSEVVPTGDNKYIIRIYCGGDDSKIYTRYEAVRVLRHELRHMKDYLEGKESSGIFSELSAIFYEWSVPISNLYWRIRKRFNSSPQSE